MSLEIAILDETGKPKVSVSLTVEEHWALVQQAKQMALPLWLHMSDYYSDADYDVDEVSALSAETTHLRDTCRDSSILAKLKEIGEVLDRAIDEHTAVCVIAD